MKEIPKDLKNSTQIEKIEILREREVKDKSRKSKRLQNKRNQKNLNKRKVVLLRF
jgi:hypothetical protein